MLALARLEWTKNPNITLHASCPPLTCSKVAGSTFPEALMQDFLFDYQINWEVPGVIRATFSTTMWERAGTQLCLNYSHRDNSLISFERVKHSTLAVLESFP